MAFVSRTLERRLKLTESKLLSFGWPNWQRSWVMISIVFNAIYLFKLQRNFFALSNKKYKMGLKCSKNTIE